MNTAATSGMKMGIPQAKGMAMNSDISNRHACELGWNIGPSSIISKSY